MLSYSRKKLFVQSLTKSIKFIRSDSFLKPINPTIRDVIESKDDIKAIEDVAEKKIITANQYYQTITHPKKPYQRKTPTWAKLELASSRPNIKAGFNYYFFRK